jgi:dihydroorotate dehydrogenase
MISGLSSLAQPLLLMMPPEQAHEASLLALEKGLYPRADGPDDPCLAVDALGLRFPNPVGMAPGFDKDGRAPDALLAIGFGYTEVGTITPLPQPGNPSPRLFRLPRDRAVINRLGFNSGGHAAALARLERRQGRGGIVGINVGANKDSDDRPGDYVKGIETFAGIASYFTCNISSPNTPGLRDLQAPAVLDQLLTRVMAARDAAATHTGRRVPVLVKIAPDVAEEDLAPIVERMLSHAVDGIVVANTTVSRHGLKDVEIGREAGGLSGPPLFHRSTVMLAKVARLVRGRTVLIGSGGIHSGETALAKIEAGASLLQLYSSLVFEGVGLVGRIKAHLAGATKAAGASSISALVGRRTDEWADRPVEPGQA